MNQPAPAAPARLGPDGINYLNMGLMALSAVLAYAYPFELFLLVYAVLGPLHYLTEISWLHDRNYYVKGRYGVLVLLAASGLVTVLYLGGGSDKAMAGITFFAFAAAPFLAFFKGAFNRFLGAGTAALAAFLFSGAAPVGPLFGLLLPTLIHVFVFTGLFILAGALRGRSASGILSLLFFAVLGASFLFLHPGHAGYRAADYVRSSYGTAGADGRLSGPFIGLNYFLARSLGLGGFGSLMGGPAGAVNAFLYRNPSALALMSFIAFAYTYHYLNWFSKTSVIRWHEAPKARMAVVAALWLASLGVYAWSYSAGLRWLFFLSLTHVFLEFPLNHRTAAGILKEAWGRAVPGRRES